MLDFLKRRDDDARSGGAELSDEELLDRVAEQVVLRRMAVPAILFLESSKPLSFVGSQFLVFMEPFVRAFFSTALYERFALLMEDRDQYEALIRTIEQREGERDRSKKAEGDVSETD